MILQTIPGLIEGSLGKILTTMVKYLVAGAIGIILIAMFRKYKVKKNTLTRNLIIMFLFYALSPIFASFDIVFGWDGIGNSVANIMSAFANILYFWFILEIYFEKVISKPKQKQYLLGLGIGDIGSTLIAFILHFYPELSFLFFIIIHAAITVFIYITSLIRAKVLIKRIDEEHFHAKLGNIMWGIYFGLFSLLMFLIDQLLSPELVTIFSLIGWAALIGMTYFTYRGFI